MDAGEVVARSRTVAQLADIVQAMRTLASGRRRQAQQRLAALQRYAEATRSALAEALALLPSSVDTVVAPPPTESPRVIALFTELGFVGALNDRLLERALAVCRQRGARLIVVGARGRRLCRERSVDAIDGGSMPTTVAGAQATAQRLLDALFGALVEARDGEVWLVFAEHEPPLGWKARDLRVFPPDVSPAPRAGAGLAPLHALAPERLVVRAVEEYGVAQMSWAVGEAFACEQAARFVAMDASRRHIDEKLSELRALERQLRQEAITNEILEIASGAASAGGRP